MKRVGWRLVATSLVLLTLGLTGATANAQGPNARFVSRARSSAAASSSGGIAPPAAAPHIAALALDPITFSEYPIDTSITDQYQSRGVIVGGDSPFITDDGANPTSPVLSGSPRFQGAIELQIVDPATGAPSTTAGIALDVGYINSLNSVEISYFDSSNNLLGSVRANAYGINTIQIPVAGIARVRVAAVEDEPFGFGIDNVSIGTAAGGVKPRSMIEFGDSYSSGEGLLLGHGLEFDCGTEMPLGSYFENSNVPVHITRGSLPSGKPCDTITKGDPPRDVRKRPATTYHNECHRAGNAWPNQVRQALGVKGNNSLFVACSGAVTANLGYLASGNYPQYQYRSPNGVAGGHTQADDAKEFAKGKTVDLVTVGIGGNDAGFGDLVRHCLFKQCLSDPNWAPSQIAQINNVVYYRLVSSYSAIRAAFPDAAVLTYGYPSVLDPDPKHNCGGVHFPGGFPELDPGERGWAEDTLLPALNQAIADAAATSGITYMPIFDVTRGHEVCSNDPWINGMMGSNPVESFHPNQEAHDAIAHFFLKHYTDGHEHLLFSNPVPNATIPPPYSAVTTIVGDVQSSPIGACGGQCLQPACSEASCNLDLNLQNFSPNTTLTVVAHSKPMLLGHVKTDATGRARVSLRIPAALTAGLHYVDLTGTSPTGVVQQAESVFLLERVVTPSAKRRSGYWMLGSDGVVYPFGDAIRYATQGVGQAVAIAPKSDGSGYWIVDGNGNVFARGSARNFGGRPALRLDERITTIAPTPEGGGYWLFSNQGRAFAYGDAKFFGDMGNSTLNGPVIASVATPTGRGYYMVASDGGVFTFGDARFHGSTGAIRLNRPVVGISPTRDNKGYWLVASDGGVFAFNAPFRGSMGATPLSQPVDGLVAFGNGYLMVAADGGVFDFSNKPFLGSLGSHPPTAPIVGLAAFTSG